MIPLANKSCHYCGDAATFTDPAPEGDVNVCDEPTCNSAFCLAVATDELTTADLVFLEQESYGYPEADDSDEQSP